MVEHCPPPVLIRLQHLRWDRGCFWDAATATPYDTDMLPVTPVLTLIRHARRSVLVPVL